VRVFTSHAYTNAASLSVERACLVAVDKYVMLARVEGERLHHSSVRRVGAGQHVAWAVLVAVLPVLRSGDL
jgi:hypothetical protein